MPRQTVPAEVSTFVKGLITEASPLTFPDNASLDELNFILNKDGSRQRRLGMEFKEGSSELVLPVSSLDGLSINTFKWESVGGDPTKTAIVLQCGKSIYIIDASDPGGVFEQSFVIGSSDQQQISMASVDGVLVCVSGDKQIATVDYRDGVYTKSSQTLKIRDLFGVQDMVSGKDLLSPEYLETRPTTLTSAHTYNLRNQTFAIPRWVQYDELTTDCIKGFYDQSGVVGTASFPSNADSVLPFFFALPNDGENREAERFMARECYINPLGSFRAPRGYFVIDALERGKSRLDAVARLSTRHPENIYDVTSLPQDKTPGGATVVAQFAGRVFFAGFSGDVIDGDSQSPRLTSYVLFSKLVDNISDIGKCYQEGDPTSKDTPDVIATDGGFIRLDGAYGIQKMVSVGSQLIVVAENGVWGIQGGSDYGFNAENYLVKKYSEHGCVSPSSVVLVDNTVLFWGDDGIYNVAPNQYGDWGVTTLTATTIQKFYDDIDTGSKKLCKGFYDAYERKVRWLYDNDFLITGKNTRELILDLNLSAFYVLEVDSGPSEFRVVVGAEVPPFRSAIAQESVTVSGISVTAGGDDVVITSRVGETQLREFLYVVVKSYTSSQVVLQMASYSNTSFLDWGVVDAAAYLVTGYMSGGDFQRYKQVPYITVHSRRTETGFDSDYNLLNQSSCKVQSMWEWTNSANSNRWGREFEAYRLNRLWVPSSSSDEYDDGFSVVTTKNKLRGKGRVLSLKFSTSPGKDLHLYGWSMLLGVNGNV